MHFWHSVYDILRQFFSLYAMMPRQLKDDFALIRPHGFNFYSAVVSQNVIVE
jgi:hypothetical protein